MDILIKGMEMPKDCPMCPMAHYDMTNTFRGCENVTGKKHAINDPVYANSSTRPEWCPFVEIQPHGRLVDADAMIVSIKKQAGFLKNMGGDLATMAEILEKGILQEIENAPTIIEAEEGE